LNKGSFGGRYMIKRPFFKSGVEELEKIFKSSQNDRRLLEELANELQFRNTVRAKKLYQDITKVLNTKSVESKFSSSVGNVNLDRNIVVSTSEYLTDVMLTDGESTKNGKRIHLPSCLKSDHILFRDDSNSSQELSSVLSTTLKRPETPRQTR